MMIIVSYDIAGTEEIKGARRLRKIAKVCKNYGQRVQYSVFECLLDPAQWAKVRHDLIEIIDEEKDSLRFYFLGANYKRRIEHVGAKETYDPEEPMII